MKLSALVPDHRWLLVGEAGTGKTRFLGTLAQMAPTVLVTADASGLDTLRKMAVDVEVLMLTDWADAWDIVEKLRQLSTTHPAVAVDDLASLQSVMIRQVQIGAATEAERKLTPAERALRVRAEIVRGNRKIQLQQWGEVAVATEAWMYEVLALPFKVKVMTAGASLRPHPRTEEDHVYPNLKGSLRFDLAGQFGLVANTFVAASEGKPAWCATTRPHPRITTKDRHGEPRTWIDPTATKFRDHCLGKGDSESQREAKIGTGLTT